MTRLLVLRPQPGADRTAARARALGFDVQVHPLFVVRPLDWTLPDPSAFDAILMTSANAARHGGPKLEALRHLPVHAVGRMTGQAARAAGFENVTEGSSDGATALAQAVGTRVLHLTGREHIAYPGVTVCTLYAADALPGDLPETDIALLHSPRAARLYASRTPDRAAVAIAAISANVAQAAGTGWRTVGIADQPTDESLLAAAARLCDQGAKSHEDPQ